MPDVSTVRVIKNRGAVDVSVLLREGVIVNLEIGRWRAEGRIHPEDVGLSDMDPAQLRKYLQLGKKTLIPPALQNKLRTLENCARIASRKYAFDTVFGKFVPATSFEALDREMARYEEAWFAMRDELCEHFKKHQKEVVDGYRQLAVEVYKQMRIRGMKRESYARSYARRIVKAVPTVELIRESFHFDFQIYSVPESTVLDSKIRERILSEEASLEKLKTIRQSEEQVRAMHDRVNARTEKNKNEKIDKFLNSLNEGVRKMVFEVACSAKQSIVKNKTLIGKTSTQLKHTIERFRMLNVLNDTEIDKQLNDIETLIKPMWKKSKNPNSQSNQNIAQRNAELVGALTDLGREAMNLSLDLAIPEETRVVRDDILGQEGIDMKDVAARGARADSLWGHED